MNFGSRFVLFTALGILVCITDLMLYIYTNMGTVIFIAILIVGLLLSLGPLYGGRNADVQLTDTTLRIKAPFVEQEIPYSRIDALEFRTAFSPGLRFYGYGGLKKGSGDFSNGEFGAYTFSGDASVPAFVVLKHSGKNILVFNTGDEVATTAIYDGLRAHTDAEPLKIPREVCERNKEAVRRSKRNVVIVTSVAIIAIVALVLGVTFLAGHTDASLDDDSLTVKAFMVNEDIAYTDITLVELREDVGYGSRVAGYGGATYLSGKFMNDEFGKYTLAVKKSTSECIVVHHTGGVLVFNLENNGDTETFHADLLSRL